MFERARESVAYKELAAIVAPNFFVQHSSLMASFAAPGRTLFYDRAFNHHGASIARRSHRFVARSREREESLRC